MTPVGILLVILGLAAAYQAATRGPALIAGIIAIATVVVIRSFAARASSALAAYHAPREGDRWARPSRAERRLLARDMRLTMSMTTIMGIFPKQTLIGCRIARQFNLA